MKASLIASLFVAGLLLVMASAADDADKTKCLKCGRGMVAAGCACNQVCNRKPSPCPLRPCLITPVVCACRPGLCLPNENSTFCVKPEDCISHS